MAGVLCTRSVHLLTRNLQGRFLVQNHLCCLTSIHSTASKRPKNDVHFNVIHRRLISVLSGDGIVRSPYTCKGISDKLSFHEFITSRFDEFGDATAIVDGQTGHSYSYRQLKDSTKRLGSALVRIGFKQNDVMCVYMHNIPEYALVFLAVSGLGGIVSTANPLYTVDELTRQVRESGATFVMTVANSVHTVQMVKERCPQIKDIIVANDDADGCLSLTDLLKDSGDAYPQSVRINPRDDVITLPYSSGTTGLPKGVMLTHFNINVNIDQSIYSEGLDAKFGRDVWIGLLPFFHLYGQAIILFSGLYQGVKIVTLPKFELEVFLDCVVKYKATLLHIVPPIVLLMAKHPVIAKYDLSSVDSILTAAAPCKEDLAREFKEKTGIPDFRQGYGMTETSPVCLLTEKNNTKLESIGRPVPLTEYKVIDTETGATLGPHNDGELLVRGPHIMKGYLNNEEATRNTINDEGWLQTGDIVSYDEEGYFYAHDRIKELIKYKGFQVPPAELEGILLTHPAIQDSAVIGIPDEEAGELPRAYVVTKPGMNPSKTEILEFVNAKVAPSKRIRAGVKFVKEIPKSATGKILRRVLREVAARELKENA